MNTQQTSKSSTSNRAYWAQVVVLGLVVGFGLQFAQAAWTTPPATAPGGTITGPITTSNVTQRKEGRLNVGGVIAGDTTIWSDTSISGETLRARTSLIFESDAMKNCARIKTNSGGRAVCDSSPITVSGVQSCSTGNVNNNPGNEGLCSRALGEHKACFLTEVRGIDGDDIDGLYCKVTQSGGSWTLGGYAKDSSLGAVCSAICID